MSSSTPDLASGVMATPRLSRPTRVWIACGLIVGTVAYVVPSVLHGNPPSESAELTLRYVAERPSWRMVHLLNIAAVLVLAVALAALGSRLTGSARNLAQPARIVLTATTAVFAVYFSIHAMALPTAATRLIEGSVDRVQILSQTEAVELVLGSVAFTAQAMLGVSVTLYGLVVAAARELPSWLGWVAVVAGIGWSIGALVIDMAIVVPFIVATWVWLLGLAIALLIPLRGDSIRA